MREAVHEQRADARVADHHLELALRGRVALECGAHIERKPRRNGRNLCEERGDARAVVVDALGCKRRTDQFAEAVHDLAPERLAAGARRAQFRKHERAQRLDGGDQLPLGRRRHLRGARHEGRNMLETRVGRTVVHAAQDTAIGTAKTEQKERRARRDFRARR